MRESCTCGIRSASALTPQTRQAEFRPGRSRTWQHLHALNMPPPPPGSGAYQRGNGRLQERRGVPRERIARRAHRPPWPNDKPAERGPNLYRSNSTSKVGSLGVCIIDKECPEKGHLDLDTAFLQKTPRGNALSLKHHVQSMPMEVGPWCLTGLFRTWTRTTCPHQRRVSGRVTLDIRPPLARHTQP